jgi:hypothetical protein
VIGCLRSASSRLAGYNQPAIGCLYQVLGQAPEMHLAPLSLARAGAGSMLRRSNLPAFGLTSMQPITCCLWPGWKKLATNHTYLACTGPGQPWPGSPGATSAGKGTNQALLCAYGEQARRKCSNGHNIAIKLHLQITKKQIVEPLNYVDTTSYKPTSTVKIHSLFCISANSNELHCEFFLQE